ncbi:MAG TPA: sigma 54-interacting transcriptional regulator, partial [Burkholderiaceae bacterium]
MNDQIPGPVLADAIEIGFDRLLVELSARFVNLPNDDVDAQIESALAQVASHLNLDRAALAFPAGTQNLEYRYRYCKPTAVSPFMHGASAALHLPWYASQLAQGITVALESVEDELPAHASWEREMAQRLGTRSCLQVPIVINGAAIAMIGLCSARTPFHWNARIVQGVKLLGEMTVNAILRRRKEQELAERAAFENLLMNTSASLINSPVDAVSVEIERGLARVTGFLGGDACLLYEFGSNDSEMQTGHLYMVENTVRFRRIVPTIEYPYILGLLQKGIPVQLDCADDLPADALIDRRGLAATRAESFIAIPIRSAGGSWHTLIVASAKRAMPWPSSLLPRLRLIGEVFANSLARKHSEDRLRHALADIGKLKDKLEIENRYLQDEISREQHGDTMIGASQALAFIQFRIEQVAPTDATVLLLGETGTGKGLVARQIHDRSNRRSRPLISVNCAALPAALIEAELFGHEKGAFSGAHARHLGRFEVADRSTLFLDEIGELPLELQAKLLRVLQDGSFERVGSAQTIVSNVRIIASTNRDLKAEVAAGRFREDLYYRLNVFPITMPPLREREGDIRLLVMHLADRFQRRHGRRQAKVSEALMRTLERYSWPGNIREVENVIERAVIVSTGPELQLAEA